MATMTKKQARQRRHKRIRRKLYGSAERPRLTVFLSASHVRAQLIDDVAEQTLVNASTDEKANRGKVRANTAGAVEIGRQIAERAREKGIENAVFDRSGFKYHGLVKALADSVRENGVTI